MSPPSPRLKSALLCLACGLGTLIVAYFFLIPMIGGLIVALESIEWPVTEGVIVVRREYEVVERNRRVSYVELTYTYRVGNDSYRGERFSFAGDPTRILGSLYKEGMTVDVYYDPDEPKEAILFRRYPWPEGFAAALLLILGLLATVVFGIHAWFPQRAREK